ncbi:hypothetical protein [Vibrio campbellii]|uniref:hypothetical protein n=1 Tax=Vibrio campbellii TaxID=680 RepID=UPI00026C4A9A|nr:hypothetical protein [Vibrio campbellii]AXB32981.1 hypothetical protein DSB67_15870 [Vibrio campbellii]UTZ44257.1 hypothetical protein HB764_23915 [Vibrio campbellii]
MAFTFDNEVYLFGAFFTAIKIDGVDEFPDWHTQPDLTRVNELTGKIRPIFWWHTVTQIRSNMD